MGRPLLVMKLVWWAWSDLRRRSNPDVDMSAQAKPLWPMALVVGFDRGGGERRGTASNAWHQILSAGSWFCHGCAEASTSRWRGAWFANGLMAYAGSPRRAVERALAYIANSEAYLAWPYSMTRVAAVNHFCAYALVGV